GYSRTIYLRFQLAGIDLSQVTAATLRLTPNGTRTSQTISVYGLNDGVGEAWAEGAGTGLDYSATYPDWIRGANAPGYNATTGALDGTATTPLGSVTGPLTSGQAISIAGAALLGFLQ